MRRVLPVLLALVVVGAFVWTLALLYEKSREKPLVFETTQAKVADVIHKTVAAGAIVPRREITIKPRVSGVLERLSVEPGDLVKAGELIAEIKIIPNVVSVNSAEGRLRAAEIRLDNAKTEHARLEQLFQQGLAPESDYSRAKLELALGEQELEAAKDNLQLVREGAIRGSGKVSNLVRSTVDGMVIEVPVEVGASVTEANNFNEGTTIASVADMSDLIFEGNVDESEVGKLKEGMPVSISVGAIEGRRFSGRLEYISPKGVDSEGTIEFEVKAALQLDKAVFVRANYSANADIILERRDHVLTLDERVVQFDDGKPFIEIEKAPQVFEKRPLKLGLSDGIRVQVLEGVDGETRIKVPSNGQEYRGK